MLIVGMPTPPDATALTGRVNPSVYSIGATTVMLRLYMPDYACRHHHNHRPSIWAKTDGSGVMDREAGCTWWQQHWFPCRSEKQVIRAGDCGERQESQQRRQGGGTRRERHGSAIDVRFRDISLQKIWREHATLKLKDAVTCKAREIEAKTCRTFRTVPFFL